MTSFLNSIGKRKKTPEQLVSLAKSALLILVDQTTLPTCETKTTAEKSLEKRMKQIKVILYGEGDFPTGSSNQMQMSSSSFAGSSQDVDVKSVELSRCLQSEEFLDLLIDHVRVIPFETRKDCALIFNNLCRRNVSNFASLYLNDHFQIVLKLIDGYAAPDAALSCGSMLREIIRYEHLHRRMLFASTDTDPTQIGQLVWMFFDHYVHLPNFDIASDAFNTLKELLVSTNNKNLTSEFLEHQYDEVFVKYESLLQSENYVTRRRSLKMLGEILLDRSNFNIMIKYISSKKNLKTIMNMLRDKSPNIQFEAFHVFKVFVANPYKPADIASVLFVNKAKLIVYLSNFHCDKDDPQFIDEKRLLIDTLETLEDVTAITNTIETTNA